MNKDEIKSNVSSSTHWIRLGFMLLFAALLQLASLVMWVVATMQFFFALITGSDNVQLRSLGNSLSQFIYQTLQFLSYNSEDKPFPFKEWPRSEAANTSSDSE